MFRILKSSYVDDIIHKETFSANNFCVNIFGNICNISEKACKRSRVEINTLQTGGNKMVFFKGFN